MRYLLSKKEQELGAMYVHFTTTKPSSYPFSFSFPFLISSQACLIHFSVPSSVNIIFHYPNIHLAGPSGRAV